MAGVGHVTHPEEGFVLFGEFHALSDLRTSERDGQMGDCSSDDHGDDLEDRRRSVIDYRSDLGVSKLPNGRQATATPAKSGHLNRTEPHKNSRQLGPGPSKQVTPKRSPTHTHTQQTHTLRQTLIAPIEGVLSNNSLFRQCLRDEDSPDR